MYEPPAVNLMYSPACQVTESEACHAHVGGHVGDAGEVHPLRVGVGHRAIGDRAVGLVRRVRGRRSDIADEEPRASNSSE